MADAPSSPAIGDPNAHKPEPDNPNPCPDSAPSISSSQEHQPSTPNPSSNQTTAVPPPPMLPNQPIQSYTLTQPQPITVPPAAPSYRPVPIAGAPQFSPLQNYQAPGVQPPGVSISGGVPGTIGPPLMQYAAVPGQAPNLTPRPFVPMPNGYAAIPATAPGGFLSLFSQSLSSLRCLVLVCLPQHSIIVSMLNCVLFNLFIISLHSDMVILYACLNDCWLLNK